MIEITKRGRLGNNIFQNVAAAMFSKKFDLKVKDYLQFESMEILGFKFPSGTKSFDNEEILVNDNNYVSLFEKKEIDCGLKFNGIFSNHIPEFIKNHKEEILSNFDLTYGEPNNDLLVHVRLGDLTRCNPGLEYYCKVIESLTYDKGYITTDEPDNELILALIKKYNLNLCKLRPANTIAYGKNFNNLILSKSTFSWWMAFLSKAENIIYPSYENYEGEEKNLWGTPALMLFRINNRWKGVSVTN